MPNQKPYPTAVTGARERSLFGEDVTIDLVSIANILLRRKWLIMTVAALGTAVAAVVGMKITPEYTAKTSVMIDPRQLQVTNIEQVLAGMAVDDSTMATHIGLLQSRDFVVEGRGTRSLQPATGDLDCGNSGTSARLLAGIAAAQPFVSTFVGDASLSRRPMRRIAKPLSEMGASISLPSHGGLPMTVRGGKLRPVHYFSETSSAQVISAGAS